MSKLSFASERMQDCAHNFIDFYLQTTSTVSEVSRCRSPLRYLPSSPLRWTLRRWDVEQSLFTDTEIDLCGRSPPLLMKATDFFVAPHWGWLERSSCLFAVTLLVFSRADQIEYFTSINHLSCGFYLNFNWRLASKASPPYSSDLFWLVPLS